MPCAESNSARPLMSMRPASGRSRPATARRVRLLPAPDGPNSAMRLDLDVTSTSSAKCRSPDTMRFRICMATLIVPRITPAGHRHQPSRQQQDHHAGHGRDQHQQVGGGVVAGLHRLVNGDRQRLGAARQIAGDHQRGANRPAPARRPAARRRRCARAASGSVTRKNTRLAHAQHPRRVLQLRVDVLERRAGRLEHQRKRHHGGGDDGALPGEDQLDAPARQRLAQHAAPTQQHQQVVAQHRGRQHQRQRHKASSRSRPASASATDHRRRRCRPPPPVMWPTPPLSRKAAGHPDRITHRRMRSSGIRASGSRSATVSPGRRAKARRRRSSGLPLAAASRAVTAMG